MLRNPKTITTTLEGRESFDFGGSARFACDAAMADVHAYIGEEVIAHWHPELEAFVLDEGAVLVSLPEGEVRLGPGEGYVTNAGALHAIRCATPSPCTYRSLVFDAQVVAGASGSAIDIKYVAPFVGEGRRSYVIRQGDPDADQFRSYVATAHQACAGEPEGFEFQVRDALSGLLMLLRARGGGEAFETAREARLKQTMSWVDDHLGEHLTVGQIGASVGVSARECQRMFAEGLGTTPMAYVRQRRMELAAQRLRTTDEPIGQVGLALGFDSPSYFTAQFRQVTGMTPRAYRAMLVEG